MLKKDQIRFTREVQQLWKKFKRVWDSNETAVNQVRKRLYRRGPHAPACNQDVMEGLTTMCTHRSGAALPRFLVEFVITTPEPDEARALVMAAMLMKEDEGGEG